jgi:hypothetical protein
VSASVRGVSSSHLNGTTSLTFTQPASSAQGDLQLIIMESCDSTTTAGTPNTPSGWEKIHENTVGNGVPAEASTCTIFARIAPSSPADQLVDGVLNHISGRMIGFTAGTHGVSNVLTDIVVGTPTDHGTSTSTVNTASINVPGGSLIVWVTTFSDDASDTTNAQNHTNANLTNPLNERWDNTVATGAGGGQAVVTAVCAGTTTGIGTWDHDTAAYSQSVYLGIPPLKVTAVLAAPMGGLSGTAAAAPKRSAVLAAPLGTLTATVTAVVEHPAVLASVLGGLTATTAATVTHPTVTAILDAPLGSLSATATAGTKHPVVAAAGLGVLAAAITATPEHPATLAASLGALTATASATVTSGSNTVSAVLLAALGGLTGTATATPEHAVTASAACGGLSATATAGVQHGALGASALGELVATAQATATTPPVVSAVLVADLGALVAMANAGEPPPPIASVGFERFASGPEPAWGEVVSWMDAWTESLLEYE